MAGDAGGNADFNPALPTVTTPRPTSQLYKDTQGQRMLIITHITGQIMSILIIESIVQPPVVSLPILTHRIYMTMQNPQY